MQLAPASCGFFYASKLTPIDKLLFTKTKYKSWKPRTSFTHFLILFYMNVLIVAPRVNLIHCSRTENGGWYDNTGNLYPILHTQSGKGRNERATCYQRNYGL